MISFFVHGNPQSQGSMRGFVKNGKPVLTTTNKSLGAWRQLIAATAQEHARMHEGPVGVFLYFKLPRPKSLPKKVTFHTKRPDIDKLARAVLDALTGVMWHDDSQVMALIVSKGYAEQPGLQIVILEAACPAD